MCSGCVCGENGTEQCLPSLVLTGGILNCDVSAVVFLQLGWYDSVLTLCLASLYIVKAYFMCMCMCMCRGHVWAVKEMEMKEGARSRDETALTNTKR